MCTETAPRKVAATPASRAQRSIAPIRLRCRPPPARPIPTARTMTTMMPKPDELMQKMQKQKGQENFAGPAEAKAEVGQLSSANVARATNLNAKFSEGSSRPASKLSFDDITLDRRGYSVRWNAVIRETRLCFAGAARARGENSGQAAPLMPQPLEGPASRQPGCPSRRRIRRPSRSPAARGSTLGPALGSPPTLGLASPPSLGLASQALGLALEGIGAALPRVCRWRRRYWF